MSETSALSFNQSPTVNGRRSLVFWLAGVLTVSLLLRFAGWFCYRPVAYSDTNSYHRLALAVLNGWNSLDGTRTPGYPVFLALLQADQAGWQPRAWLAQNILGLIITGVMFYLGWQVSGQAWFGGVMALAHTLNLGQLFFEANLLTETLTTCWVILALAGAALWLYHPRLHSIWLAAAIGLVAALAAITRPLFVYLPFWILVFIALPDSKEQRPIGVKEYFLSTQASLRHNLKYIIAVLLPTLLVIGGWMAFIQEHYGDWALTTMTGYHLVQHTGGFFEYVPDQYAALRDTYLKYRAAHIAETGTQANTIWEAIPEMEKASGLGFYDLSRKLTAISIQLIRQHPDLFLRNVIEGWWMFWRAPVYWSVEALRLPGLADLLHSMILLERGVLFACNLLFVVATIGISAQALFKPAKASLPDQWNWLLIGSIWICSIAQTLLDHGDNPRFLVPLQSAVVLWAGWWAFKFWQRKARA